MFLFQYITVLRKELFKLVKKNDTSEDASHVTIPENITEAMLEMAKLIVKKKREPEKMLSDIYVCFLLGIDTSVTVPLPDDKNAMIKEFLQEKLDEVILNENFKLIIKSYEMSVKMGCSRRTLTVKPVVVYNIGTK